MARTLGKALTDTLAPLGLKEQETAVYRAALALGARPASVIAQKAGLKRGHTYNVLQGLGDKGLVQEFVKGGVRHYVCSPPQSLLAIAWGREEELRRTKARLEELIPELVIREDGRGSASRRSATP
jgi:sugar-specific transcriptional regulator TrmB